MVRTLIKIAVGAGAVVVVPAAMPAPPAAADRAEPVPLYGSYDTFLDHSQQTFSGLLGSQPRASEPSMQAASFATKCDAGGYTAHWLLVDKLAENPNAPALFDYQ
jgi:hypothetical protein